MGYPFELAIEEEYICKVAKVSLHDYYQDPQTMIEAQHAAAQYLENAFGLGKMVVFSPTLSSYAEASVFGLEILFGENGESPWPARHSVFSSIEQACEAEPWRCGEDLVTRTLRYYRIMRRLRPQLPVRIEKCVGGPITTAVALRGQDFFLDLYDEPEASMAFLEKITDTSMQIREKIESAVGAPMQQTWIFDDYAGMLPPDLYEEFAIPCYRRIYERFGRFGRILHSELLHQEHLRIAKQHLDITYFNPASAQNLTICACREVMGEYFDWQITPQQLAAKPEEAVALLDTVIEQKPPVISLYPYDDTPPETLAACIRRLQDA